MMSVCKAEVYPHVWWAAFVQFLLIRHQHCIYKTGHPFSPTHTRWESVDKWSRVPTGTVVQPTAFIAAVSNAITNIHSL